MAPHGVPPPSRADLKAVAAGVGVGLRVAERLAGVDGPDERPRLDDKALGRHQRSGSRPSRDRPRPVVGVDEAVDMAVHRQAKCQVALDDGRRHLAST